MLVQVYAPLGKNPIVFHDKEKHNHQVARIDGAETSVSKCSGYCSYCQHSGYLTDNLMKKHNCIENECKYYFKRIKEESNYSKKKISNNQNNNIISYAKMLLEEYEGIAITDICEAEDKYIIRYAQICNYDDVIKNAEEKLSKQFGTVICMKNINGSFDNQLAIVMGN